MMPLIPVKIAAVVALGVALSPFSADAGCDLDPLLRKSAKSSLPPSTARGIEAKIRYAETMRKLGPSAPASPQDELRIARGMAQREPSVVRAIDVVIRCLDERPALPARLTIHFLSPEGAASGSSQVTVDGRNFMPHFDSMTLQLGAGTHEIGVYANDAAGTAEVTLAEGEPRSINVQLKRQPYEFPVYDVVPNVSTIGKDDDMSGLVMEVQLAANGQPVAMRSLDRIEIVSHGTFDVTNLFKLSKGRVRVADAAALREIPRQPGPLVIRIVARADDGRRIDAAVMMLDGHEPAAGSFGTEDSERLQQFGFDFVDGAIKPHGHWVNGDRAIESLTEESMPATREGSLQVRAFSENGTLVFRSSVALLLQGTPCMAPTRWFTVKLPLTARFVEVRGWTPQTSGRFEVSEFEDPQK
jgi:hypothetical protein